MDNTASSANNLEMPSIPSPSISTPVSDSKTLNSTPNTVSNSTVPFTLASFLSSVSSSSSGSNTLSTSISNPAITTFADMHGINLEGNYLLNSYLNSYSRNVAMGSPTFLQQSSPLADWSLPILELSQNPESQNPGTEEVPNSPEKSPSAIDSRTSASGFFRSLGSPQIAHRNSSDSLLSGEMSADSLDLDTEDQHLQNLYLSYVSAAASNGLFQNSFFDNPSIFPQAIPTPTMTFDQNNSYSSNFGNLFGEQISVGQALGLQNSALAALLASNEAGPNAKNGSQQPIDGRKNRRNRTVFTKFQHDELEKCFQSSPYPDVTARERVSKLIELPEAKVQVWLKNRRSKFRKLSSKISLENSTMYPSNIEPQFGSRRKVQKKNSVPVWNSGASTAFAGLFPPILSTGLTSPPAFYANELSSTENLRRSIFENLMRTSQLASFSV